MNKSCSGFMALILAAAMPIAALAQPRMISDLSDGALIGPISSTAQLQNDFDENAALIAQAGVRLGLSAQDIKDVRRAIDEGKAAYVVLPRRLDGMAGKHDGVAFAVHNILIPDGVHGWEVDLQKPSVVVRVFVPNRCGNISYLNVPRTHTLAQRSPYHLAAFAPSPAPSTEQIAYVPPAAPEPMATPAPATTPEASPVAVAPLALDTQSAPSAPATAAAHHFALLPWLAVALIGIALSSHGGAAHTTTTPAVTAAVPTPIPLHTACPGP